MAGNLITERAFWRDPVQVFTGILFFEVGGIIGFIAARLIL